MGDYEMYKANAERWQIKEAFDNFFIKKASPYLRMRNDNEFNNEIHYIMDQIWAKQLKNPSQFFSC
jgi:hypothetical protein